MSTPGTGFGRKLPGMERRHVGLAYTAIPFGAIRDGLASPQEWAR